MQNVNQIIAVMLAAIKFAVPKGQWVFVAKRRAIAGQANIVLTMDVRRGGVMAHNAVIIMNVNQIIAKEESAKRVIRKKQNSTSDVFASTAPNVHQKIAATGFVAKKTNIAAA